MVKYVTERTCSLENLSKVNSGINQGGFSMNNKVFLKFTSRLSTMYGQFDAASL